MEIGEILEALNKPGSQIGAQTKEVLGLLYWEMVQKTKLGTKAEELLHSLRDTKDPLYDGAPMTARMALPGVIKVILINLDNDRKTHNGE